jgi:hypothetical protein
MAIWQDVVSDSGFNSGYQSVRRFVRKLQRPQAPQARAVILTAPGEDYGKFRVMVRNGGESSFDSESPPRSLHNALQSLEPLDDLRR